MKYIDANKSLLLIITFLFKRRPWRVLRYNPGIYCGK